MNSLSAAGSKLSQRIRQAYYDPLNVEAFMYMGKEMVPMYAKELKRSTWSQMAWYNLLAQGADCDRDIVFPVNGTQVTPNAMDYLLAAALEVQFPEVTLVNTQPPVNYVVSFNTVVPDAQSVIDNGSELYYFIGTGENGLINGTIYVGSLDALTADVASGGLAIPESSVQRFVSYAPRHQVGWGQYAVLGAIESVSFMIDSVPYETLTRQALYNALQFRMREDVFPVAGQEATNLDAILLQAGVGSATKKVLGPNDDERCKSFIVPFSFTTSALADRGENGKQKSAFPVMLACRNIINIKVCLIEDLRKLLVLEREVLKDLSCYPVIFVANPLELGTVNNNMYITDGTNVWTIANSGFVNVPQFELIVYFTYATLGQFTVSYNSASAMSYSPFSPYLLSNLNALYLQQTGVYLPLTRPNHYGGECPCSETINYEDWIVEKHLPICVKAKARGAIVTDLERGMMKADCRPKKYMYQHYSYLCDDTHVKPGEKAVFDLTPVPGQFIYAYTFAQNATSALQGQLFNYTNDTDYVIVNQTYPLRNEYIFEGKDSCQRFITKVQGYEDDTLSARFVRYVADPLFAQRAPRVQGMHITPIFGNFINAIYPDGSINAQAINEVSLCVKTTPSGYSSVVFDNCNSCKKSCECSNKPNTHCYHVHCIPVSWKILVFQMC